MQNKKIVSPVAAVELKSKKKIVVTLNLPDEQDAVFIYELLVVAAKHINVIYKPYAPVSFAPRAPKAPRKFKKK